MLGKLLKYDFKALYKVIFPFYGALLILTGVCRVLSELGWDNGDISAQKIIFGFSMFAYVAAIVSVAFATVVMIITRFYKNMVGDEGYLMFTLPVTANSLLVSKTISAFLFALSNIAVIVLSVILITPYAGIELIFEGFSRMPFSLDVFGIVVLIVLMILVALLVNILIAYTAMSGGHIIAQNRLVGSVVAYIGINVGLQILCFVGMIIAIFAFGNLINNIILVDAMQVMTILVSLMLAVYTILAAAFYFVSKYLLTKKLNLA